MKQTLAAGPDPDIMLPLFDAAVGTGMRPGELLALRPAQVLSADGVRHVVQPDSKNGDPRRARRKPTRDDAPPIELVHGEELCDVLKQLRIGVAVEVVERVVVQPDVLCAIWGRSP